MKGFINLLKPEGMSSAYAVTAVKKKFNLPCGHMGTLDPMASGVLPVGISKTSRLFNYLLDKKKTYEAEFTFGYSTDTLDSTGKTEATTSYIPTKEEIEKALSNFIGEIEQLPPKYSAKCVDGKRGYELARKGIDFNLQKKKVTVSDFILTGQTGENSFTFKINCKGGTYIRSLARDLAGAVGSLAVMSKLKRTASGVFNLENGVSVEEFKNSDNPKQYLIAPDLAVDFEKVILPNEKAQRILNGLFDKYDLNDGVYRVYNEQDFWGIGSVKEGILKIDAYVR